MRILFLAFGMMVSFLTFHSGTAIAEDYKIDRSHAYIGFEIEHLGFSTIIGRYLDYSSHIHADWDALESSTVRIAIRTDSVQTGWGPLDDHLQADDFFHVEKYPEMVFESRSVIVTGENMADIMGDLTMIGVTKPVVLKTRLVRRGPHPLNPEVENVGIEASAVIKRSEWGLSAYVGPVSDEVIIRVEAEMQPADTCYMKGHCDN